MIAVSRKTTGLEHSWGEVLHLPHWNACRALRDHESENLAHMWHLQDLAS